MTEERREIYDREKREELNKSCICEYFIDYLLLTSDEY